MHITKDIKFSRKKFKTDNIRTFFLFFILYAIFATIFSSLRKLAGDSNQNFQESNFIYWKMSNMACLVILALLIYYNRVCYRYHGRILFAIQVYLYICFSIWKSSDEITNDPPYILVLPLVASINWKFKAAAALLINILEAIKELQTHEITPFYGFTVLNFLKSFVLISVGTFLKHHYDLKIFTQHMKDNISLSNLQNLIKNVFPLAIMVINDKKVIFQNIETKRLLRYPKFIKVEDVLNKIIINEVKYEIMLLNSDKESVNEDGPELRLFDYLQSKFQKVDLTYEFEQIYGHIEEFDTDVIYKNISPRAKYIEIKIATIIWEGQESIILIMTEDSRREKLVGEQSKYKNNLLATVSHDLRTPLNGIIGLLEMVIESIKEKILKRRFPLLKFNFI